MSSVNSMKRSRSTRARLATITPGSELTRAFGHVALVFDEPGATSALADAEDDLVAYSYGGYILPEIRPRFADFGPGRLWDAIASAALASLAPIVHGTQRVQKIREGFGSFRRHAQPEQRLLLDELELSPSQLDLLHQRVRRDFERVEPGERGVGTYLYDHLKSNCATRVRDAVFFALGRDQSHPSQQVEGTESLEQVMAESLEAAIATTPAGLRLFPNSFHAGFVSFLPGIPATTREPGDFLAAVKLVLERLSNSVIFSTPEGNATLARALYLLNSEIPRKPRRVWETLFTPQRLRRALVPGAAP